MWVCWQVSIPTMRLIELHVQTGIGMHVNITIGVLPVHAHLHAHLASRDTQEYFIYTSTHENIPLISMNTHTNTHTHTEPYTPDRLIVWGCMDAWIKLLVQESKASRLIKKKKTTVCCRTGEKESEVKEEKARSGRLILYLINQSRREGGLEKQHQPRWAQRGLAV